MSTDGTTVLKDEYVYRDSLQLVLNMLIFFTIPYNDGYRGVPYATNEDRPMHDGKFRVIMEMRPLRVI